MNILTFDIEDWFHILDHASIKNEDSWHSKECRIHQNTEKILTHLEEKRQKATFFCLGWVAKKYPEILQSIDNAGHEIGSHSNLHQLSYELDRKGFSTDLQLSIDAISNVIGKKVRSFRAPGFSFMEKNKWTFEILLEKGIEFDCSIFPAQRSHGGFISFGSTEPSIVKTLNGTIKEFPINTIPFFKWDIIFSGGGYFRLIPYNIIRYFMKKSPYVMCYFHPRDFDPNQPVLNDLSAQRRFKSYYGLKSSFVKFKQLLNEFSFVDLAAANTMVDWDRATVVKMNMSTNS